MAAPTIKPVHVKADEVKYMHFGDQVSFFDHEVSFFPSEMKPFSLCYSMRFILLSHEMAWLIEDSRRWTVGRTSYGRISQKMAYVLMMHARPKIHEVTQSLAVILEMTRFFCYSHRTAIPVVVKCNA